MKKFKLKNLLYLAVMVFGAFTFTGCSNDNEEEMTSELLPYDFVWLNNFHKMSSFEEVVNKLQKDGFEIIRNDNFTDSIFVDATKTINGVTYRYYYAGYKYEAYSCVSFVLPSTTSDKTLKSLVDAIFKLENKIAGKFSYYEYENDKDDREDNGELPIYKGTNKNEGMQKFIDIVLKRDGGVLEYWYEDKRDYSTSVMFSFNEDNQIEIGLGVCTF